MAKTIGKPIPSDLNSDKNRDVNTEALRVITAKGEKIKLGGGKSSIEKHKAKGKLTARERIALLTDEGADFLEIGLFTAYDMYKEQGGAPSAAPTPATAQATGSDVRSRDRQPRAWIRNRSPRAVPAAGRARQPATASSPASRLPPCAGHRCAR